MLLETFAVLGALFVGYYVLSFFKLILNLTLTPARPKISVKMGQWAIVTGASDGIGKEFALQLAKLKFNVCLISRSKDKLDLVSDEIKKLDVDTLVIPFDFTTKEDQKWSKLQAQLQTLDVGVLVNNVAMNHAFPVPFLEEDQKLIDNILQVNINATLKMIQTVVPSMVAKKAGLVLNIGSMAGKVPSGLLATYSATKSFLKTFSIALAHELKRSNVEHVNTYFVTTNMSKIRKASFLAPTPKDYVNSVLCNAKRNFNSTPYPSHQMGEWIADTLLSEQYMIKESFKMHESIRKRALAKQKRSHKLGRLPSYEYSKARTHMARVSFDLDADLTSLFNWNTKMLFVSVLVEWENKEYKQNQAVIWDDVIMRKEDALLQYKKKRSDGTTANMTLQYQIIPWVGFFLTQKQTQPNTFRDKALDPNVLLFQQALEKHKSALQRGDIDDVHLDSLLDLGMAVQGDTRPDIMRSMPRDKKMSISNQTVAVGDTKSPNFYIDLLHNAINHQLGSKTRAEQLVDIVTRSFTTRNQMQLKDVITELKVQCQCQSLSWLNKFVEDGGLETLFQVLDCMHTKQGRRNKHYEIESETLKILRLIANHHKGILTVLQQQNLLNILIFSLDSPLLMARTATIDFLLAIVTLEYPKGHQLVMAALEHFREDRQVPRVFDTLVESLSQSVSSRGVFGSQVGGENIFSFTSFEKIKQPTERDIKEHMVSVTALVRFLVEVPSEFEYRMHIRNELLASNLGPVFQKIKSFASLEFRDVMQHVDAFEQLKISDFQYLLENMDSEMDVDIQDPTQLIASLRTKLSQDENRALTTLIQNIVVGTALLDQSSRSFMLHIIEKAVMYIVLDQNGMSNFTDAFKYSVDQIIAGLSEIEQLQAENEKLESICAFQENEIVNLRQSQTNFSGDAVFEKELQEHKQQLEYIYESLDKMNLSSLKPTSGKPSTTERVSEQQSTTDGASERPSTADGASDKPVARYDSSATVTEEQTELPKAITTPPPPGMGPPPPPGMAPPMMAPVKLNPVKYKPTQKVRKIHWDQVQQTVLKQSIWSKLENTEPIEDLMHESGLLQELEKQFQVKESKPILVEPKKTTKICILDEKRAQNINTIVQSIRTGDSALSESLLRQLSICFPTMEEKKKVQAVQEKSMLRDAELFLLELGQIPRGKQRIEILAFKSVFSDQCTQLTLGIQTCLNAFRSITQSKHLPEVLQIILAVGNYMNASHYKTNGFRVSFLEKIVDLKGQSITCLDLIVQMIKEKKPELLLVIQELSAVKVRQVAILGLEQDLNELSKQQKLLNNEMDTLRALDDEQDKLFTEKAVVFHKEVSSKMSYVQSEFDLLKQEIKKAFIYFGESDTRMAPEELLGILTRFIDGLEKASKQVKKPQIQPKKVEKQVKEEQGHLDSLLDSLKNRPAMATIDSQKRIKRRDIEPRKLRKPAQNVERKTSLTQMSDVAQSLLKTLEALD
ncbi:hypothetical protein EDD86DRAFT_250329 [Gorgonomyces haynaldii]|nr:hypothetical protein EDD86DRAFT_250329 [Gorgonomyces haynaldii]